MLLSNVSQRSSVGDGSGIAGPLDIAILRGRMTPLGSWEAATMSATVIFSAGSFR